MNENLHEIEKLLYEKRECVIDFPEWLLPPELIKKCSSISNLAIVELAGRDSVAAAVQAVESEKFTDLVPVYVFTGTEYGPFSQIRTAFERLRARLPQAVIHDLIVLGSPKFWQALNGRFVDEVVSKYGFYTPCVGCHMYLHSVRIPLAKLLGNTPIISGERELHNGLLKVNQTAEALDAYLDVAETFGIELLFPLRHLSDGKMINEILGFQWEQGKDQLDCVLSGNYKRADGNILITGSRIQKYLKEFIKPVTLKIIESYLGGRAPDHIKVSAEILA